MSLKIELIESFDRWRDISHNWNSLLLQSRADTIFLTWEWLSSWAECYLHKRRQLFIAVISEGDELVGIAPWYIHPVSFGFYTLKQIRFLGNPETASDYLDVFIKKGREREIASSLYDFLFNAVPSRWDCLWLGDIPSQSSFILHFVSKIKEEKKQADILLKSYCPYLCLPKRMDDFLANLSSNQRQKFRRHLNFLKKKYDISLQTFRSAKAEGALDDFFAFYKEKRDTLSEQPDIFHQFLKKLASRCKEKSWLQIDVLEADKRRIASILHLRYQKTLAEYLMAVDKRFAPSVSIGNVLLGLCLEKAIQQKLSVYDFLRGTEDYKFHWTKDARATLHLISGRTRIIHFLLTFGRFIKSMWMTSTVSKGFR